MYVYDNISLNSFCNKTFWEKIKNTNFMFNKVFPKFMPFMWSYHHQVYSPGWALSSSGKCRQRPLYWASASPFLQPRYLVSSSTLSIRLDFGRPRPRWSPGFECNERTFQVPVFNCNQLHVLSGRPLWIASCHCRGIRPASFPWGLVTAYLLPGGIFSVASNPWHRASGCPFFYGSTPLTCLACEALSVA